MPRDAQFTVFNLKGKHPRKLPSPPKKIHSHQVDPREWASATKDVPAGRLRSGKVRETRGRVAKKKKALPKLPKRAIDAVKLAAGEVAQCMHCGAWEDDPDVCCPIHVVTV